MERLTSCLGLLVFLFLVWLMSSHKRRFPWRVVAGGMALQFVLAALIFKSAAGQAAFSKVNSFFDVISDCVDAGCRFVFGEQFRTFYFAFKVLPTIVFFSSLMSILYYLGVLQWVVKGLAKGMRWTLRTSGAETLSACANVFMGQTEAPLLIRPFMPTMTQSELNAVMIGGFATISGGIMAAFVGMGIDGGQLLAASLISAPGSLLVAKILVPETETPVTMGDVTIDVPKQGANLLEAAVLGASDGMKLALNVAAMLLAFTALITMLDKVIILTGTACGQTWSLPLALGYAFSPLAWLIGVEKTDCLHAGELLGLKITANEMIAYEKMMAWKKNADLGVTLSARTQLLMTFALCGFANFASIGIQIGGLGGLAPTRQSDLAKLGLRAMLGGALVCCMTACIAGIFN